MTRMDTNQKLIFKDEAFAVIGAAMEVHNQLGAGFAEAVYQEAMELEMRSRNIPFVPQQQLAVRYKEQLLNCKYIADFVCYQSIIIELKSIPKTGPREEAQVINYLKVTGMKLGLLINFGDPGRLDWHRLIY